MKKDPSNKQKNLHLLMSGQKYPIKMILLSVTKKGYNGENLYHVIARHRQYGLFNVDCSIEEIEDSL